MKRLANVINQKFAHFNTVSPGLSLRNALYKLSFENLEYLVVQEDGDFIGILSEHDVAHKLFSGGKPMEQLAVKDMMNNSLPVGSVHDDIAFAVQILDRYNSRYIAVFDGLHFKGIVSETDLLKQTVAHVPASMEVVAESSVYWSY